MKPKIAVITAFILGTAIIFIAKLYYIQVMNVSYKLSAENNAFRHVTQYPARGVIFDRNGKLLVYNEASYDLKAIPNRVGPFDTMLFCELLHLRAQDVRATLASAKHLPVILAKQISPKQYAVLQEYLYRFPGFYAEKRTVRKYPDAIAAHMLGYVGEVDRADIDRDKYYRSGDYIGKSGVEKTYEEYLRGRKGVNIFVVDALNRIQGRYRDGIYDTLAIAGRNITTTLDAELQKYGELLMSGKLGSIVAIEPQTGEILALISSPTYNPNLFVGQQLSKNYNSVANQPDKPLYNRALKALYPPGSTFKPVSALIALQEGVIDPSTVFVVNGYNTGTHIVKDHISGAVGLEQSIQSSSNAYYCHVFKKIITDKKFGAADKAYENWKQHLHNFGLGIKLGTDLAYESKGIIYPATYFDKYYGKGRWNHNTIISLAIGQGELGFTPLQIANMTAAIANRGYYYIPHIVKEIDSTEINKLYTVRQNTGIEYRHFTPVVSGMEKVVSAGTARIAYHPELFICGKTGTAQNPHGEDHSIFMAFAPKDNPKIAIVVYVENAGFGSTWAAPIASLLIEKYLTDSISRPDMEQRMIVGKLKKEPKKPE